jgi:PhzF family phenazine biosynthesis protein
MTVPLFQVDAFTSRPFAGNPAAVCLLDAPAPEGWMQQVASEMNLSETAFVDRHESGPGFRLRWFTPKVEVDLCGHATLAAAHVLWESGRLPGGAAAVFQTRSGILSARRDGGWIELDFPATPVRDEPVPPQEREALAAALGADILFAGRSRFDVLAQVGSEQEVRALAPDFRRLAALPVRGVIVTAPSDLPDFDFVSRFFAPQSGVDEDPVTGSAHCCLGPFWAAKLSKSDLVAHQVSARGGVVRVRVSGARVALLGQAVTVLRGELLTA